VDEGRLDFLWLELTNRCNLRCVHCYTESSPTSGGRDLLTTAEYESVMAQAWALGCRRLQFIGGEPQLHPDFLHLLTRAKATGFEFIEVFSNLTRLSEATLRFAAEAGIRFATSVYSDDPAVHNAITTVGSSHARTMANLGRLVAGGVATRAAVIRMDQAPAAVERTRRSLLGLGVGSVRAGEVRGFGRGQALLERPAELDGLCGHCWAGKLCVAPDGDAYTCVMARNWPVGNVLQAPLAEIVRGQALAAMRRTIHDRVWAPRVASGRDPGPHDDPGPPPGEDGDERPDQAYLDGPEPDERGCDPSVLPCEPDGPIEPTGGSVGCDVIEGCGPEDVPLCPQSAEPTGCPQSGEPPGCPQSPA
jgi:MoaA/NifB/PqqE/SkfB family radical SAM enzyme